MNRIAFVLAAACMLAPVATSGQVNFQKTGYYVALGDSVAAGEGAVPVSTSGYAYQLYEHGVFGTKQQMDFSNGAIRGGRSWDLLNSQVPQVICAEPAQRPTVVTITAGANDFLRGDANVVGIASRVVMAVNQLLNNDNGYAIPVLDPFTNRPCRRLQNVTILVSNYYRIPHPDPAVAAQFDAAIRGFDSVLQMGLANLHIPAGSRVAVVDLYSLSLQHEVGFVLTRGPGGFDIHPTNLGHTLIAREFKQVWLGLQ